MILSIIWWYNFWLNDSTRFIQHDYVMTIIFASNSISLRILSLSRIFELKKVSLSRILTRDWYFEEKIRETKWFEFWAYSKSHAYAGTCIWHLPRTFWAYPRYPPYHYIDCYRTIWRQNLVWQIQSILFYICVVIF